MQPTLILPPHPHGTQALDETLHFDKKALPLLGPWCSTVQRAATLGWQDTLAAVLEEAEEHGLLPDYVKELHERSNLVASAALSGCLGTMIQVSQACQSQICVYIDVGVARGLLTCLIS
jgi:hypothetical protein